MAVQMVSVTALLAEFELWPGRWVLRRAAAEDDGRGLCARLAALPVSLSRIWSRLGGGDPAAEISRVAVLATISRLTDLEPEVFEHGGAEPGFFLDGVLDRLLGELDQPLDNVDRPFVVDVAMVASGDSGQWRYEPTRDLRRGGCPQGGRRCMDGGGAKRR